MRARTLIQVMAVAFLIGTSGVAHPARAQLPPPTEQSASSEGGKPLFGLRPSLYGKTTLEKGHFQYAVRAGNSFQDAVQVLNLTDERIEVDLYPADLIQTADGSLSPAQAADERNAVGAWIDLERDTVVLGPKDKRFVSFTVKIPEGTAPGDHVGAVVGSVEAKRAADGLTVESRVALIARVLIPGSPKLDVDIGPLEMTKKGGDPTFTVELLNKGNLLFTAKGSIDISNGTERVASLVLQPPDVYLIPNGRATFTATWTSHPLFGNRTAVASFDTVTPEEELRRISSDSVAMSFSTPQIPAAITVIVLVIGGLAVYRRRSGNRRGGGPQRPATTKVGVRS